jgi:hypothetical protein
MALNEQLLEGCRRRLGDRLRGHDETIGERLVRDLEAFHALPTPILRARAGLLAISEALTEHAAYVEAVAPE